MDLPSVFKIDKIQDQPFSTMYLTGMVLILAGALFYATLRFNFLIVQMYCTLSTLPTYPTRVEYTRVQKMHMFATQNEGQA
jgi:hypothetical protein